MLVYSNSCSFGDDDQGPDHNFDVYSRIIAKELGADCINRGKGGACNRRIIRTTLRDVLELKDNNPDMIVLIGLSEPSRHEMWQTRIAPDRNDGYFAELRPGGPGIQPYDVDGKPIYNYTDFDGYYKEWLQHFSPTPIMINLLTDMLMLTGWLDANNIKYIMFSNVDKFSNDIQAVGYEAPFLSSLRTAVEAHPRIINPWEFSFGTYALEHKFVPRDVELYGDKGHPDSDAHKFFAQYLLNKINTDIL